LFGTIMQDPSRGGSACFVRLIHVSK
jgi:hypothetical protein